jgi:glycosyltransferase involved in cell wall biosynthesis
MRQCGLAQLGAGMALKDMAAVRGTPPPSAPREPGRRDTVRLLVASSDLFPPTRVDVAVLFGAELASRGHRIDWIFQSGAECAKGYATPWGGGTAWVGSTDLGTSLVSRLRKHVRGILHDLKVFSLPRRNNYDLIQVKDKFIAGVFAVIAARVYRKPFVYWLSYPFPEAYLLAARDGTARYPILYRVRGAGFRFLLYRVLLPAADHVFVQSEQMRRDVAAEGVPESKMTAVPMGVRLGDQAAAAARCVIPPHERCFLYLGTLIKVRRLDFLIRVLAAVRSRLPDVKLYLVGSGEDPSDVQQLIEEAVRLDVLSAVVFVGQLPQPQALRYVSEADVCVSPFFPTPILNSTSPTKLIEYMAMGKAVVANHHPEQDLVIAQSGAGYSVPYEEAAFAQAIIKLLEDPDNARTMGARGRRYVEEHRTYGAIANLVESELLRIAARRTT